MRKLLLTAFLCSCLTQSAFALTPFDNLNVEGNVTAKYWIDWTDGERTDDATTEMHIAVKGQFTESFSAEIGFKNDLNSTDEFLSYIDKAFVSYNSGSYFYKGGYMPIFLGQGLVVNKSLNGMLVGYKKEAQKTWFGVLEEPNSAHTFLMFQYLNKLPTGGEYEFVDIDEDKGNETLNTVYLSIRPLFRADTGFLSTSAFYSFNKNGRAYGAGLSVKSSLDPEDFTSGSFKIGAEYQKFEDDFTFPFTDYDGYGEILDDETIFGLVSNPTISVVKAEYRQGSYGLNAFYVDSGNDTKSDKEFGGEVHVYKNLDVAKADFCFGLYKATGDDVDGGILPSWKVLAKTTFRF